MAQEFGRFRIVLNRATAHNQHTLTKLSYFGGITLHSFDDDGSGNELVCVQARVVRSICAPMRRVMWPHLRFSCFATNNSTNLLAPNLVPISSVLSKPLRVSDRAVKVMSSFVKFELARFRGFCRFCEKGCDMGSVRGLESPSGMESLPKNRERIAASDDDTGGKIHGIAQTLDSRNSVALQNEGVAHRFHAENPDATLGQNRQDLLFETIEVGVHYVERHLDGIEREAMLRCRAQHLQMNIWTLVACKADETDL